MPVLVIRFDHVFGITKSRTSALDSAFVTETNLPRSASDSSSADLFYCCHEAAVTCLDNADPAGSVVLVSKDEGGFPAAVEAKRIESKKQKLASSAKNSGVGA